MNFLTNIVHFTNEIVLKKPIKTFFFFPFFIIALSGVEGFSQDTIKFFQPSPEFNNKRFVSSIGLQTVGYGGSLAMLSSAWYKEYDKTPFHFFDDSDEWLQMDKAGHLITSWYLGRIGTDMMKWSGVKAPKAVWLGSIGGFVYLTGIEMMDGFSDGWGFSWTDFGANTLGAGLIIGQNLLSCKNSSSTLAKGVRGLSLKFSFHQTDFPDYRPALLGNNFSEQLVKDYNGQSYWLSFNLSSFFPSPEGGGAGRGLFPKWLNIAAGYGGEYMITGSSDDFYVNPSGNSIWLERHRQYYLSLDVDLTRIKTKSHFLKTVFKTFSFIKIPAPALELSKKGIKAHAFYY